MLENLAVFYHGSIYKTRPFERGLKMMFQDQPLFGGATLQRETPAKVAVLGTTTLDQRSVVFANYNRQDQPEESKYKYHMPMVDENPNQCSQVFLTASYVQVCLAMT
jgi:hypothetical protein